MTEFDILKWFAQYLFENVGIRRDLVIPTADIVLDLGLDSFDSVLLVMEAEEKFYVNIPSSRAEEIRTIGDAIKIILEIGRDSSSP